MIEVIDNIVPPNIHEKLWEACRSSRWYFGWISGSDDGSAPFWRMDLTGDEAADSFWNAARFRCERLVGSSLEVIRQYANGHTYGLGGQPHKDDSKDGTYTLLYYPMLEWAPHWNGETIFYKGGAGMNQPQTPDWEGFERTMTVRPLPNRAILFDARLPHEGRAPSRQCQELRVTVAYKLRVA